ncbi:putative ankyrin repeat protein [Neofusicoccum parvum UCRNP2]|uniref:Putative ankyrin repeat protein n=1 Tax=Botryosphaeria parva (strain UCR-NP2) TaxID=1287680 RepID=R1GI57_BOTPV|nr:putative ankyrin repeat protein [Neofusicoccum parvum UCRNP2]
MVSDEQDPVSGLTPLAVATIEDNADKVRQLLKQGAKVDARSRDRETPLLLAAWKTNYNRARIIQLLLEKAPPVDATCPKAENNTPLMFVVLKKDLESIRLLRKAGASLTKKNNNGFTATKLAEDTNDKAVILALTPAKERSALAQLVDLVVGFLLFIIAWVNDKAKGVVRQVSGLNPELDQRLNQDVNGSEQPSNAKFVENVDKIVKDSPLERFFEDKKDYIQDLALITDGMPSKENKTEFVDAIVECGVKFMVGQIGTAQAATKFLDGIRSNTDIAKVVYVTSDQLDVKFADLHENEKDLDRWLIETLFSPIKDREDKKSQ